MIRTQIRNEKGKLIGEVDEDGVVYNHLNHRRGVIDTEGVARDQFGLLIGKINTELVIRNRAGQKMGFVDAQNMIRNQTGVKRGSVKLGSEESNRIFAAGAALMLIFNINTKRLTLLDE